MDSEYLSKTEVMRAEIENLSHRLDKNDVLTNRIHELASSVQLLAQKVETSYSSLSSIIEKLGTRVDELERKPGKRWESSATQIISLIIACAFGLLMKTSV